MDEKKAVKRAANDKFVLRFHSEEQRTALKIRAAQNRRTMNAELLFLIDRGVEVTDGKRGNEVK